MTPQEFVTKVYNVQEGIVLDDLWPIDDKYREVLYQANLVIDEFTKQEDWSFLRECLVLGDTMPAHTVPQFKLPEWVDRVSTEYGDCVRLHPITHYHCEPHGYKHGFNFIRDKFIKVPWASNANDPDRGFMDYAAPLMARNFGTYIEFTRRPIGRELRRVVTTDVQRQIPHLHICSDKCTEGKDPKKPINYTPGEDYNPCKYIEESIFDRRYTDYIVWKTAYQTAKYSPIAGGIRAELNDTAQKLLSKLRQLDASKTTPDVVRVKNNLRIRQVW